MDQLLDVSKGLHIDYHPISQPAGTYRHLLNAIRITSGAIENERGTVDIPTFNGKKIVGNYVLNKEIILFLYPSEIGVITPEDTYKKITDNKELAFTENLKLSVEGEQNFKGNRIVYFSGRGYPMRFLNLDDENLLTSPTFKDDTKLQVTPKVTEITVDDVVDAGNLPTGVYQATARLLTKSTNAAPFGLVSPLVSIIDDAEDASFNERDGAAPQTISPKAIRFTVSNIDAGYEFIEIAIITYIGTANVSNAWLVARLPIQGRSTISFTYSSTDQHKEAVDLSAIAVKPVVYDSAESVLQKDGILTLSNLVSVNDSYDFQSIANRVTLKYFIEEIPFDPGYKDEINAALKKGYMRGEVYSFAITPFFKSSFTTTAYHIPAPVGSTPANTTTKVLGTFTSEEEYPIGRGFPLDQIPRVRHHIMPTIEQEPLTVKRGSVTYLRILGVEADFTVAQGFIPTEVKKNLQGFSLVRQIRTPGNKTILTQGIASSHISGTSTGGETFLSPFPKGLYNTDINYTSGLNNSRDYIGFLSPESVIYESNFIGATQLVPVGELRGTQSVVHAQRTGDDLHAYILLDYDEVVGIVGGEATSSITPNTMQYIPAGSAADINASEEKINIGSLVNSVNNHKSPGYLFFKLNRQLPIRQEPFQASGAGVNPIPEFYYNVRSGTDVIFMNGKGDATKGTSNRYLYNLVRVLPSQYGSVLEAKYIFCDYWKFEGNTKKFFGGDTFISKFAVMASNHSNTVSFKVLSYFFVESEINTNYRHYKPTIGKEGDENYVQGTTPYYPKYTPTYQADSKLKLGFFNLSHALGHGRGYNKQYSFENSLLQFFPIQLAEENVTKFENRTIYSEQSVEGEQLNAKRIFLPNNYHDIPKDTGVITNTFVHNGTFYHHTEGGLWQSFFNERVTQASSIGEVYLGTGGVFTRPSVLIHKIKGGYGGTQGKWGVSTPYGYFFVDARHKKIFMLNQGLEDISSQGLSEFFDDMEETDDFQIIYDYEFERFLLTSSKGWTLSYQTELKSWTGYHSYLPYIYISRGKSLYSALGSKFHKMNKGKYQEYFDEFYPMELSYILNVEADSTKSFDNVVLHSDVYDAESGKLQLFKTFDSLQVLNDTKDTSVLQIKVPKNFEEEWQPLGINEVFAKKVSNEFRLSVPFDLLVHPDEPGIYVDNPDFRPRITGKWARFNWKFSTEDKRFVLHTIKSKIKGVHR